MDNGILLALVTIIGSLITLGFTKWLDADHKLKEHKLSIRSIYVARKIDAAEAYIVNVLKLLPVIATQNQLFDSWLEHGEMSEDIVAAYEDEYKAYIHLMSTSKDTTSLYFRHNTFSVDFANKMEKKNRIYDKIDILITAMGRDGYDRDKNYDADLAAINKGMKAVRKLNNEIVAVVNQVIDYLNEQLSKYDIV